ncbi:MAG: phospholipid carrier-dependent glycosyltransferase [Gemmatimonadota bacterium]|nr:phospholipid carrier-dependent glycosyltransferase [Gemmatimonadota bacterium]
MLDSLRRRIPPELAVLTALSALTRFWALFTPRVPMFDETTYQKFTADYLAHVFYVDVHPPLAEQLYALWAHLFHISAASLAHPDPAPVMRVLPALAGTFVVPVLYLLLRQLSAPRRVAAFGAALLLFDNALVAESRILVPDSMLLLFALSAVTAFLSARRRAGGARGRRLGAAALFAGLAVATKWTGLSALGIIGLIWLVDAWRARDGWGRAAREGALLVGIPVALYLAVFAVHFAWMTHSGPGDMWMSPRFRATLAGDQFYKPGATMPFYARFAELNVVMRRADAFFVGKENPAASPWYSWPVIRHPIEFWAGEKRPDGRQGAVFLAGNPVVWYGILIGLGAGLLGLAWRRRDFTAWRDPLAVLAVGYVANFLPFALIRRLMYQYSYFMALAYSAALAALAVGILAGWAAAPVDAGDPGWRFPSRRSAALYWGLLAAVILGFIYYSPITYGWPISPEAFQMRFWLIQRHF